MRRSYLSTSFIQSIMTDTEAIESEATTGILSTFLGRSSPDTMAKSFEEHSERVTELDKNVKEIDTRVETLENSVSDLETSVKEQKAVKIEVEEETDDDDPLSISKYM